MLGFVGIGPVRQTLIGSVGTLDAAGVAAWEAEMVRLGRLGN
jgi:hypothetical protein